MTEGREGAALMETAVQHPRYFWTDWLAGCSLKQLSVGFILLSLADLLSTVRLLQYDIIREGNIVAEVTLVNHGLPGFIIYKIALTALVLGVIWVIRQQNWLLARNVLWTALLVFGVIALRHVAIFAVSSV